jgi:ferrochelatase
MRNWKPFIKEAVEQLESSGVTRIIGIPLAPQFSTLSVIKYLDAARSVLPAGISFDAIETFHSHPLLIEAFAERLLEARPSENERVIFTAHSLPKRVVDAGDAYAREVAATAEGVARRAAIVTYSLAYQSAGRTPEPWIGPDISDMIRDEASRGARRFLIAPVGFVCDHTEILFDIDVQAKKAAADAGATLRRTSSLNTSPTFIRMLEDLARKKL